MAKKPDQEEFESALPVFITVRKPQGLLLVQCPREDCGNVFMVKASTWYKTRTVERDGITTTIVGRVCAYCSRTSRLTD